MIAKIVLNTTADLYSMLETLDINICTTNQQRFQFVGKIRIEFIYYRWPFGDKIQGYQHQLGGSAQARSRKPPPMQQPMTAIEIDSSGCAGRPYVSHMREMIYSVFLVAKKMAWIHNTSAYVKGNLLRFH